MKKEDRGKCCPCSGIPAWLLRPYYFVTSDMFENVPLAEDFAGKSIIEPDNTKVVPMNDLPIDMTPNDDSEPKK